MYWEPPNTLPAIRRRPTASCASRDAHARNRRPRIRPERSRIRDEIIFLAPKAQNQSNLPAFLRFFVRFAFNEYRMNGVRSPRSGRCPIFPITTFGRGSKKEKGVMTMRTITKLAIAAVTAGGLAVAAAAPAEAGVHVGIGVGVPGYGPGYYGPGYYGGYPCYSPYANPYYCGYPAYGYPGYVGFGWGGRGGWGHGGYRGGYHGGGHGGHHGH
jgi:hypothetical protein